MKREGDFAGWWADAGPAPDDAVLEERVRAAHAALIAPDVDLGALGRSLEALLDHLADAGRNGEAYRSVDAFFCLLTAEHVRLVDRLDPGWQDLVDDLGLGLGTALEDPEQADRDGVSPERLLARVRSLLAVEDESGR